MENFAGGVLLGGIPGVASGTVLIIGGGTVSTNAAKIACSLGAKVYILDTNLERLRYLSDVMPRNCFPLFSSPEVIRSLLKEADLVIGAVLIHDVMPPKLITWDMLGLMKKGSVIVDVAVDQGAVLKPPSPPPMTIRFFEADGIIHYCVANMPGAVSMTSTLGLTKATLPYALELADKGWQKASEENPEIARGVNIVRGKVTHKGVADAFMLDYVESLRLD